MRVRTTLTFEGVTTLAELRRIVADTSHMGEQMAVLIESTPSGAQVIITDPKDTDTDKPDPGPVGGWHPSVDKGPWLMPIGPDRSDGAATVKVVE